MKMIKKLLSDNLYAFSLYSRQIAGTLVLFVIAHYLSVYEYGLFTSYKSIAFFCLMVANLGYANYILVSSQARVQEVRLKILIFLVNAIFILLLTMFFSIFFKMDNHLLFFLVALRTFFDGIFFALILPYFQAAKKFNIISYVNIGYSVGITIIALTSYILKLSLLNFLLLNILLGLINFIQCSLFAKINYFMIFNHLIKFIKMIDKSIFAYIGVAVAYQLYTQIPSLYVATYVSKEQAALFFAAFSLASIVSLLINAQVQKIIPEMIKNSINNIRIIINKNLKFIFIVIGGVFVFMIFAGKILLKLLYGQEYYIDAYPVLLIQMIGNLCIAEASVYGAYITASGNQKVKIPIQIESTAVAVISLFLLHKFGIIGASISFSLAALYIACRYTVFTLSLLKKKS